VTLTTLDLADAPRYAGGPAWDCPHDDAARATIRRAIEIYRASGRAA
jgi:hypothetical protein